MAWRKPTQEDLVARLSQTEISAFARASTFETDAFASQSGFTADTVDGILAQSAAFARDAIRSGGRCRLSPVDGTIPEGLFRPVLAIAVVDLLNRFSIAPTDARREAAKAAEDHLKDIAAGRIVPESFDAEGGEEAKSAGPMADEGPVRTLGGGLW